MLKIRKSLYIVITLVLIVISIFSLYQLKKENNQDKSYKGDDSKEQTLIDETIKEQLILEGQNEELNSEIIKLINNGIFFTVQDETKLNGDVYKLVQINLIDHEHNGEGNGELAAYFRGREDLNQLFVLNSSLENVIDDKTFNDIQKAFDLPLDVFEEKYQIPLLKRHVFIRNEDFEFVEKWIVSALVRFDEKNQAKEATVYKGAVGLEFIENSEELQVEIFIADKMNCFYYAKEDKINGGIVNDCGGLIEGNVYIMNINDKGVVEDISYVRRSVDNNYSRLCNKDIYEHPVNVKITVKNYDMSIKEIADSILNSRSDKQSTEYKAHELFGERHSSSPETGYLYVYFTSDGYVVFSNRYGNQAIYIKMTKEEFAEYEYMERFDILKKCKNLIVNDKVNPEIQ